MTLDEVIKYHEEVAEEQEEKIKSCMFRSYCDGTKDCRMLREWKDKGCLKCAAEHRQLAEWLKELKQLREQTSWIPVSERLPEEMGTYLVTLEYKEHGKGVTTLWYHGKDIGWDLRVADVVTAWMPLPEPYKAESEDVK